MTVFTLIALCIITTEHLILHNYRHYNSVTSGYKLGIEDNNLSLKLYVSFDSSETLNRQSTAVVMLHGSILTLRLSTWAQIFYACLEFSRCATLVKHCCYDRNNYFTNLLKSFFLYITILL